MLGPSARRCGPILLAGLLSGPAGAADLWVGPGGHDRPTGGGAADPWESLQYAADRARAGDTVHARAGDHAGFALGWDRPQHGTAGRPIRFLAEPGARIVRRNRKTPDGINLEGTDHVVIEGFRVDGMPRAGVRATGGRGVAIRGNRTDLNGAWGIYVSHSDDVLIENNHASRSVEQHGIYVSNSGDRPVIRGNQVWGNRDCGIHMNGDAGQGGDGIISGALVERNVVYRNGVGGGGSGINADGVQGSIFRNNLLYSNHARGISLFRTDGGGPSSGNVVVNNTVVQPADANWALVVKNGGTRNAIYSNILLTLERRRGSILVGADARAGLASDHNLVTPRMSLDDGGTVLDLARWRALGYDRHGGATTPAEVFVDAEAHEYRPRAGSPAVDKGRAEGAPGDDLDGRRRPTGSGPEVGAYEYGAVR